jgi:perosamine synthetase
MRSESRIQISKININQNAVDAVVKVLKSGYLVQGSQVQRFEKQLSEFLDVPYVSLVSSGTAALHLSLLALNLPDESGVVIPNFTFPATVNSVLLSKLRPIIADVCLQKYVITEKSIRTAIESAISRGIKVRVLLPVHEFGQPVDPEILQNIAYDYDLMIVEDAACALGATYYIDNRWRRVGFLGDLACFSFHPRKTLTTGEGGLITTHSQDLYERISALRNHGIVRSDLGVTFSEPGFNYRMTDFQAALGVTQLPHLDDWITKRRALVNHYHQQLSSLCGNVLGLPILSEGHSWQTFMIVLPEYIDRDSVMHQLSRAGIETNIGAQVLSHIEYVRPFTEIPLDDSLHYRSLALPLCEQYEFRDIDYIIKSLHEIIGKGL